ncbi:MAG: beta-ketoacyl-ACP synthase III [Gammaproteobacteria bacterium]|nr:beta-ketoacyl-ACP synthase III [Gammaproteobacteria bacterium]
MTQSKDARRVVISGTGLYTPQQTISNAELVKSFNAYVDNFNAENRAAIEAGTLEALSHSSEEFIVKASGIESRYVIDKTGILDPARLCPRIPERADEEPSIQCEIAVAAAREALVQARKTVDEVDAVIVACSNLQRAYPAMAIEVQNALGIKGFGFDMNVACSSATFGLQCARDALLSGSARCVLVLNPEICSGHLAWQDRDCHFIFGDVCTALVVERAETCKNPDAWEIIGTRLQTQFSNNIRNNFGFLNRCDESGIGARDKLFCQNGRKVFKEVVPMVAELIASHLSDESIEVSGLRRMWLHQANLGMNQLISKKVLGRDAEPAEAPVILNEYANTSSAGSIIAFHKHRQDLQSGEVGVICSFGAGYSAGSVIVKRL